MSWKEWQDFEDLVESWGGGSDMFPALWTQKELAELDELAEM